MGLMSSQRPSKVEEGSEQSQNDVRVRRAQPDVIRFEDGRDGRHPESRDRPLGGEKDKRTHSPLKPPGGTQPRPHLDTGPGRLGLDFCHVQNCEMINLG